MAPMLQDAHTSTIPTALFLCSVGLLVYIPDTLKEATVPLISTKRCNSSCMYDGEITARMLCAGYSEGKVDACQVGWMQHYDHTLFRTSIRANTTPNKGPV